MCNIIYHPFFQEFSFTENDIYLLKCLFESGVDIHIPAIDRVDNNIALEVSFKNQESIKLFDRIFDNRFGYRNDGELVRNFSFDDELGYFKFMSDFGKILLLGFYAHKYETRSVDEGNGSSPVGVVVTGGPDPKSDLKEKELPIPPKPPVININIKSEIMVSISVNGTLLKLNGKPNTTECYKAFMNYCIDNHFAEIINAKSLGKRFKKDPEDPEFGQGVHYNRIIGHNGLYYSTYQASADKERIMSNIAKELMLSVEFFYD